MSKDNETKLTKEEKAQAKADKKFAKLEAKYDKAYERKEALSERIDALKTEILNEPDQSKKDKLRSKRDALISEKNSIIITEDKLVLPMAPKTKKLITAIIAVVLVIAMLFTYVATGAVRKGISATLGWPQGVFTAYTIKDADGEKHSVKVSTYNYYFAMYYNNLQSTVKQYNQYGIDLAEANMEVDFDKKLSKQERTEDGKTQTWLEYIQDEVMKQIKATYMYYYMAVKANDGVEPEITEEQQSEIDEALENYKTSANNYGFTLSGYFEAAMGKGVTEEVFIHEAKVAYISENYAQEYQEELANKEYDQEDLEKYRDENLADLKSVDIMLFECDNEDDAKAFKAELKADGSNFADLASKYSEDDWDKQANKNPVETTYNAITYATMKNLSYAVSTPDSDDNTKYTSLDWVFSEDRKAGDVIQESTSVVYIKKPVYLSEQKTVNVRHILIKPIAAETEEEEEDEDGHNHSSATDAKECTQEEWDTAYSKAKEILDEYEAGEKTEDSFAELAKENTEDSNADKGGLYENVVPNQMVSTFDAWCFDSGRKAGDTAIVKTQYGYHIMYFVGYGDYSIWQYTAQQALASDDGNDTITKLEESVTIKKKWFGSRYFQIDTDIDA